MQIWCQHLKALVFMDKRLIRPGRNRLHPAKPATPGAEIADRL
jgi:hypothetical protein